MQFNDKMNTIDATSKCTNSTGFVNLVMEKSIKDPLLWYHVDCRCHISDIRLQFVYLITMQSNERKHFIYREKYHVKRFRDVEECHFM